MAQKELVNVEEAAVAKKENGAKKALAVATLLGGASYAFAATQDDSFGQLLEVLIKWMQGNLGKVIALFGFIGTFIVYAMTHRGSVLFIGVLISLIAGGLVGIVFTFFNIGASAFTTLSPTTP